MKEAGLEEFSRLSTTAPALSPPILKPLSGRACTIARACRLIALAIERGEITDEMLGIDGSAPIALDRVASEPTFFGSCASIA